MTSVLAWRCGSRVSLSLSLAVFVVGLPVMLSARTRSGGSPTSTAATRRSCSAGRCRGAIATMAATPSSRACRRPLRDPQTWRDLEWLVLHSIVGFAFGCAALSLIGQLVGLATLPLWFWALPDGVDWWGVSGLWEIDTLWEALIVTPLAIPLAALTVVLLRVMARGEAGLASALLGEPGEPAPAAASRALRRAGARPGRACRCTSRSRRSPGSRAR